MTLTAAKWTAPLRSPYAGTDLCAHVGFEVRDGAPRAQFDDDLWDLSGVVGAPKWLDPFKLRWNFASITNPAWRVVAKELIIGFLAPGDERVAVLAHSYRTPRSISGMYDTFQCLTEWLNWLSDQGVTMLAEVGQDHCDHFTAARSRRADGDGTVQPSTVLARILPIKYLWMYRELFSTDAYRPDFTPWDGRLLSEVAGIQSTRGNKVGPVPDHVFQPMLASALWVVDVLGPLVAEEITRATTAASAKLEQSRVLNADQRHQFEAYVQQQVAAGEPLPALGHRVLPRRITCGWSPDDPLLPVSTDRMFQEGLGIRNMSTAMLDSFRPLLESAVRAVGVSDPFARHAVHLERADQAGTVPWSLPLSAEELKQLGRVVQAAALLVTSAVSGMRNSELAELSDDSCLPPTPAYSGAMRYRLASRLIKGQGWGGVPEEWVVVEEAWRAVGLAARIARRDGALHGAVFGMKTLITTHAYARFRTWVNGPEGVRLGIDPIPDGPVNARNLRRTLAMALAYRPGGLIAAKIHLKHVHVATTEGYAHRPGGAQGIFLAEVGDEEAEHHMELTAAAFRDFQAGIMPSGPGARDVIAAFTHVDAELNGYAAGEPKTMESDRQLVNLLRHQSQYLHVGAANYCWFKDPHKALCLKIAGAEVTADSKPMAGLCDSSRCPQATHHPCHRPVWEENAQRTKVFLGTIPRGHKAARERVQADLDRTVRVLNEIDAAAGTGTAGGQ